MYRRADNACDTPDSRLARPTETDRPVQWTSRQHRADLGDVVDRPCLVVQDGAGNGNRHGLGDRLDLIRYRRGRDEDGGNEPERPWCRLDDLDGRLGGSRLGLVLGRVDNSLTAPRDRYGKR